MTEKGNERTKPDPADARGIAIDSAVLFKDQKQVLIRHNSEWYRLTITKTGKLILTK